MTIASSFCETCGTEFVSDADRFCRGCGVARRSSSGPPRNDAPNSHGSRRPDGFLYEWGSSGREDGEFSAPKGIAVDSEGMVYVADCVNDRIQVFDSRGRFLRKWGGYGRKRNGEFNSPYGVAVDGEGKVYVSDTLNHRIQVFDSQSQFLRPQGRFLRKWGREGKGDGEFNSPYGIAVDSEGMVYVADCLNDRIQVFDSRGRFLRKWGSYGKGDGEFSAPQGIAVDSEGMVYVADCVNDRIQVFDSRGRFLRKWGGTFQVKGYGELYRPTQIAVGDDGLVYSVDHGPDPDHLEDKIKKGIGYRSSKG